MGASYSLDIWLEMLFSGPIKPLGQNFALPKGTVSFDVQQWNFDHVHSFSCKIELSYQVT
jgi:hypothetical protein